jgi:hypothetical protein
MIKKKAKTKKEKESNGRKDKNELNPVEVRKDSAQMADSETTAMARAPIDEGKKGQLATVKYLFEVAGVGLPSTDRSRTTRDEESFAKALLDRLDIPDKPIALDEEDEGVKRANPSMGAARGRRRREGIEPG